MSEIRPFKRSLFFYLVTNFFYIHLKHCTAEKHSILTFSGTFPVFWTAYNYHSSPCLQMLLNDHTVIVTSAYNRHKNCHSRSFIPFLLFNDNHFRNTKLDWAIIMTLCEWVCWQGISGVVTFIEICVDHDSNTCVDIWVGCARWRGEKPYGGQSRWMKVRYTQTEEENLIDLLVTSSLSNIWAHLKPSTSRQFLYSYRSRFERFVPNFWCLLKCIYYIKWAKLNRTEQDSIE